MAMAGRIASASLAVVVAILAWSTPEATAQTGQSDVSLTGIWQDTPEIASGWSYTYQFFADGRFVFHYNQMDCESREVSYSGRWAVQGNSLILSVTQRKVLVGGHFEPANGSCGTDRELVGARLRTIEVKPSQLLKLNISVIRLVSTKVYSFETRRDEARSIPHVCIGPNCYWKLRDDPSKY